jgi:hypothetical protein
MILRSFYCGVLIFLIKNQPVSAMDFSSVPQYVGEIIAPSSSASDEQKVELAKRAFNVNDETAHKKFLFGFFLDNYLPNSLKEKESLEELKKYTFFSSNLTAIHFAKELELFITTKHAKTLQNNTIKTIKSYIDLLKSSYENGYSIDAIRAYHPVLALLTATGNQTFSHMGVNLNPEIEKLVNQTINQINNLSVGKRALFLSYTLTHEARILVEKISEEDFEISFHDSGSGRVIRTSTVKSDVILNKKLWEKMYKTKFSSGGFYNFIKEYFPELLTIKHRAVDICSIKRQRKATCHFRCLYSLLKNEFLNGITEQNEAILQWNKFKILFGEFLLAARSSNDNALQILCKNKQEEREDDYQSILQHKYFIHKGKFHDLFNAYNKAINSLNGTRAFYSSKTKMIGALPLLLAMRSVLVQQLELRQIGSEMLPSFLEANDLLPFQSLFDFYHQKSKLRSQLGYEMTLKEIDENKIHEIPSLIKFKMGGISTNDPGFFNKFFPHRYLTNPLASEQLRTIIDILKKQPDLLKPLALKPYLFLTIVQAYQSSMFKDVLFIYDALDENNKNLFNDFFARGLSSFDFFFKFEDYIKIASKTDTYPFVSRINYRITDDIKITTDDVDSALKHLEMLYVNKTNNRSTVKIYCSILDFLIENLAPNNTPMIVDQIKKTITQLNHFWIQNGDYSDDDKNTITNTFIKHKKTLLSLKNSDITYSFERIVENIIKTPLIRRMCTLKDCGL